MFAECHATLGLFAIRQASHSLTFGKMSKIEQTGDNRKFHPGSITVRLGIHR